MAEYIVEQGECIGSIAYEHGMFWKSIWDDPKNSDLRQIRKDPNCLLPGDKVYIRPKEERQETGSTEKRHKFKRKGVPGKFIVILKENDEPRANEPYTLDIDGQVSTGTTDSTGRIEVSIPPNARWGRLVMSERQDEYELNLGHLNPVDDVSGVQARLKNLGLYDGPVNGVMDDATRGAIATFQEKHNLSSTGEMDQATADKLVQEHGS